MTRRRIFEAMAAALLVALMIPGGIAVAAPPEGKGNNKGDDDGTVEPPPPPVQYQLTSLPTLSSGMDVRGMNEIGDLVGMCTHPDGQLRAFLYTAALGMVDLNSLLPEGSPWELRAANAINNFGVIVASGRLPGDTASRPLRLQFSEQGTILVEDLGRPAFEDTSLPRGINDVGEICGICRSAEGAWFLWYYSDSSGMLPVDVGPFGAIRDPVGITNFGQIIGQIVTETNIAYRVVPGEPAERFPAPVKGMYVYGLNDLGEFVGQADFLESTKRKQTVYKTAYRHDGTDYVPVGSGTYRASDINNHGDIVGRLSPYVRGAELRTDPGPHDQAFLYLSSTQDVVNLDDALVGDADDLALWFQSETAPDDLRITDSGVITGEFEVRDGGPSPIPFLLTPLP